MFDVWVDGPIHPVSSRPATATAWILSLAMAGAAFFAMDKLCCSFPCLFLEIFRKTGDYFYADKEQPYAAFINTGNARDDGPDETDNVFHVM